MPYTDYNQVLQDLADNLREIYGGTASIRFVDMPDMISGIVAPPVTVTGGSVLDPRPWRAWLIPLIGSTSGVTDMSHMFERIVRSDYPLDLSHFDTSEVTNMAYMFNITNFDSLDLSSFDTSKVTNMDSMFAQHHRTGDIDLDLTHFDTSEVTNMHQLFFKLGSSTSTASVTLDVTGWNVTKVTDFRGCFALDAYHSNPASSITELDLSGWSTPNATQMYNMFGNSRIEKMWVPSTFVATNCASDQKPFSVAPSNTCHIYTDASSASAQGWSPIVTPFVPHYNSTYEDYENA